VVVDVSVIHPAAVSCTAGEALTPGFAAASRNSAKQRAYCQVCSALLFVTLLVESFGRIGALAVLLLGSLADSEVHAGVRGLSLSAFISGALQELSIARCSGDAFLFHSGFYAATAASGRAPMRGHSCLAWLFVYVPVLCPFVLVCVILGVCFLVLVVGQGFLAWFCFVPGAGFVRALSS
jgi:hypothetical protein